MSAPPLFIPGWMDLASLRGFPRGLDIWRAESIPEEEGAVSGPVIAHSAGALYVLQNAARFQGGKIVLVNPLFPTRSLGSWLYRWLRYLFFEGTDLSFPRIVLLAQHMLPGIFLLIRLLRMDSSSVVAGLSPDRLVFVRGARDDYFFDAATAEALRAQGFSVVTLPEAGHNLDADIIKAAMDAAGAR